MKKIIIGLLLLFIPYLVKAQTKVINSKLKVTVVEQGSKADSLIVQGSDMVFKYLKTSDLLIGAAPASGSANYIQNNPASTQSASLDINGSGRLGSTLDTGGDITITTGSPKIVFYDTNELLEASVTYNGSAEIFDFNADLNIQGNLYLEGSSGKITGINLVTVDTDAANKLYVDGKSAITSDGSSPSLNTGISASEVRTLIGAGTSDLAIGTTSTTALAGDTDLSGYLLNTTDTLTGDLTVTGGISAVEGDFTGLVTMTDRLELSDANNNSFIGKDSGEATTTGSNSVSLGYQSLYSNTTGYNNVALGYHTLKNNISGYENISLGLQSLFNNTGGGDNIGLGDKALYSNTNGNHSIALGDKSLYYSTGSENIGSGFGSLFQNTTGTKNIGLGSYAGSNANSGSVPNRTGSNSIFIGSDTKANADGETNQIVIGDTAIGNGSNTVTLGNDSITDTYLKGDIQISGTTTFASGITATGLNIQKQSGASSSIATFGNSNIEGGLQVVTNGNLDWGFNALNSRNLVFRTNQTEALRLNANQSATFASSVEAKTLDLISIPTGGSGAILNIGLDTNTPTRAEIGVENFNGVFSLYDSGSREDVKITTSGNSWFKGGNVGIGTSTPSTNLEVNDPSTPKIRLGRGSSFYWDIGHTASNFQIESQTAGVVLDLNYSGAATFASSVSATDVIIPIGTTNKLSRQKLYIGGSGVSGDDISIYIGNDGDGGGYGYEMFYKGSGSGNDNSLIFKSENLGNPVDALELKQDGAATFASSVSAGSSFISTVPQSASYYTNMRTVYSYNESFVLEHKGTKLMTFSDQVSRGMIFNSNNGVFKFNGGAATFSSSVSATDGIFKATNPFVRIEAENNSGTASLEINALASNGIEAPTEIKAITDGLGGSSALLFKTASSSGSLAERMRITSGGDVLFGTTSAPNGTSSYGGAIVSAGSSILAQLRLSSSSTGTSNLANFYNNYGLVGSISTLGQATSFNTSSDYRLKEDLKDFNGLEMVSNITVYDYKWKADESRSFGVMAHELQEVLPYAVNGEKDAEEMQAVDYSKIVPLLIKSIQELTAKVEMLESKK